MILVDTSAWIEFFKGKSKTADLVEDLIDENQIALCGPVITEIARGFGSKNERNLVLNLFSACHLLAQPVELWREAGEMGAFLRRNGHTVKTMDLLIAAYVVAYGVQLLTLDSDFKLMKESGLPIILYS